MRQSREVPGPYGHQLFVSASQSSDGIQVDIYHNASAGIYFMPEQWPAIREAVEAAMRDLDVPNAH
jgi:hypothetical protein